MVFPEKAPFLGFFPGNVRIEIQIFLGFKACLIGSSVRKLAIYMHENILVGFPCYITIARHRLTTCTYLPLITNRLEDLWILLALLHRGFSKRQRKFVFLTS